MSNNNIILITGKPSSGKSTSLRNVPDPTRVGYINTDNKEIPLRTANKFQTAKVADAQEILPLIDNIEAAQGVDMGVMDTLSFAMEMFESQYVLTSKNTQKAWGNYAEFYKHFIHKIKTGTKDYVIFAHEKDVLNESEMVMETKVPVKGAVGARGVEADFTIILGAKRVPLTKLEGFENALLNITEDELEDGFKYVFQTRVTKDTVGEKMRSPMGLWSRKELYIDNDVNMVMRRIKSYYNEDDSSVEA